MSDSVDEIMDSLNNNLGKSNKRPWTKPENAAQQSHEVDVQTLNFFVSESEEDSFPFSQIQHMKRRKDAIHVCTYTANIVIKGKDLKSLYSQLRRYKISNVAVSPEELEGNVHIDSITVKYHREEENHD